MSQLKDAKEWNRLQQELKEALQKEVNIMRELLANMHQEEVSLLLNDKGCLHELLQQRGIIIERLGSVRFLRIEITTKIGKTISPTATQEEILPFDDDITTEILSLRDQLMALTEQMNRQHTQNQYLNEHPDHVQALQPQTAPRAKRKASVTTYQIKK